MRLISIDATTFSAGRRGHAGARRSRRGNAEVETALVIPVLLVFLFLIGGTLTMGIAILENTFSAENDAYRQVVTETNITPSPDPVPLTGIEAVRPTLPSEFALADNTTVVQFNVTGDRVIASPNDKAIFLTPSWNLGNTGVPDWFASYVNESHPPDLVYSLGLHPAVPP